MKRKPSTGFIPYGKQIISADDIVSVVKTLNSDYLTTGPKIEEFEKAFSEYAETDYAVAVNSGTAALHSAMYAIEVGPDDEVIVPAITFTSTANCVCFQGGNPVFADVNPETLLIDIENVQKKITKKTKAVIGVDYAGQPCDWDGLGEIATAGDLYLVADGCHALGAEYKNKKVGGLADLTVFSFHPVKHITTGEGGMITTDNVEFVRRMRNFRNHGITTDHRQREERGSWRYEMTDLGYNYRITDLQCSLGISQLGRLPDFLEQRRTLAALYDNRLRQVDDIEPLSIRNDCLHAFHLYVIRLNGRKKTLRDEIFKTLRQHHIGANVHYMPVYLHPYYQRRLGFPKGLCPIAEEMYRRIVTLPLWPGMTEQDVDKVVDVLKSVT